MVEPFIQSELIQGLGEAPSYTLRLSVNPIYVTPEMEANREGIEAWLRECAERIVAQHVSH